MTSRDLRPEQAERLREQISAHLRYVNRLVQRMDRRGFDPADALYQAAIRARDALQGLHVQAHYASCPSGVGR